MGRGQQSCFAFSPDSRLVVAGHEDGTAQVWEVAPTRPLGAPAVQPLGVIGVAFPADGRSFLTVATDGTLRHWPVPPSLEGSVARIARAVQLSTGLRMDKERAVVSLAREQWEKLRRDWRQREGQADWSLGPPVPDEDWHAARAHDAEQTGHPFTARWHLDRLIAQRPNDWWLYARRVRSHADEGKWDQAEADYQQARARGWPDDVLAWLRQEAWFCQSRRQWSATLWYLDHLLRTRPEEQDLQHQRADVVAQLAKAKE